MVIGSFPDLCVRSVTRSVAFYRALLDLDVMVDHGWYAELGANGSTFVAFVEAGHETVPVAAGSPPGGVLVSFEVDEATSVAARAEANGCPTTLPLTSELGQLHFMTTDPDGAVVDVIERVALTANDMRRLVQLRRQVRP